MPVIIVILFLIPSVFAKTFDRLAISTGGATREQQLALDGARFWQVRDSKFYIGAGIRFTSQWASGQTFKTAPASLTRGVDGLGAIFRPEKKKNIDDLTLGNSQVSSLNVAAHLFYQWSEKIGLGANIDVIGGSFGKLRKAKYNPESDDSSWPRDVSARPTPFNLLLGDDNDRGSINSEVYVHYSLKNQWALKLGVVHAFTEYTTTEKLRNNNDRFRKKNFLPTFGITKVFQ